MILLRTLTWSDLRALGRTDNANRWYPNGDIVDYFLSIRSPSRAYPHSYARAAQTKRFAVWLIEHRPDIAASLGLCSPLSAHIIAALTTE